MTKLIFANYKGNLFQKCELVEKVLIFFY